MPASYRVELNRTEVVHLPQAAAAIVVGNPSVADVSVHSEDTIFLVGRGFGDTNIIILNKAGETVMNANIAVVGSSSTNNVRVFAGGAAERSTYNCSPYCQPSPNLGDATAFIGANSSQTEQISNTFASGGSVPQAPRIGLASETFDAASSYSATTGEVPGIYNPEFPDGE